MSESDSESGPNGSKVVGKSSTRVDSRSPLGVRGEGEGVDGCEIGGESTSNSKEKSSTNSRSVEDSGWVAKWSEMCWWLPRP